MTASRGEFDRSLNVIEAKVIELFAMIAEDLPRAAEALAGLIENFRPDSPTTPLGGPSPDLTSSVSSSASRPFEPHG